MNLKFTQGAELLLHAYNAYLAAEGLHNPAEISRESLLGFKRSMDSALAEWPEFETVSHMLGVQRGDTVATAMFFFLAKAGRFLVYIYFYFDSDSYKL